MNLALFFLIVTIVFFGVVVYYFTVVKKSIQADQRHDLEEEKLRDEGVIRDEKRIKEERTDTHKRATAILTHSENIAQDLINELESALGKAGPNQKLIVPAGSSFEIELGGLSEKIKNQYITRIKSLLESLEKFQVNEAQKVLAFAEEQQVSTDKNLQQIRVEELEKVHKRIESYKEEELALFNKKVKEVIDAAAISVIGEVLTSEEQDKMITNALDKARKEGVI